MWSLTVLTYTYTASVYTGKQPYTHNRIENNCFAIACYLSFNFFYFRYDHFQMKCAYVLWWALRMVSEREKESNR